MLYHVTFADRLPGIAKKGLLIGHKMTVPWDKPARSNIKGRLFFSTTLRSAKIWGTYIPLAYWETFKGSSVPVPSLLRVEYSGRLSTDSGFGLEDSVFGMKPVSPKDIALWDPLKSMWVLLDEVPRELVHDHFDVDPANPYVSVPLFVDTVKYYVAFNWPQSE